MGLEEHITVPVITKSHTVEPTPIETGRIIITVYKARDIEKKGMFGKADPYVKLKLGKQKAKSSTVKNNYNPEWNFKSEFDVDKNTKENIMIEVFDEDLGKDDSLGSTSIDVTSIQKQIQKLWIPLNNCKSGEIFFSAEFIPLGRAQAQNDVKVIPESIDASGHAIEISPHIKTDDKKLVEKAADQASTVPASETMEILEKGHIVITVYKARDIEKKGMVGKA